MSVISIVPRLPPTTDGVGDYAFHLARQLRQDHNIQTHFIVCDRTYSTDKNIDNFPISQLADPTAEALLSTLYQQQIDTVLLHYVGYGYTKRGCPSWLVEGLEQWRTRSDLRQLITMFHEVYASSNKPWTSSFWLSSWQKNLAAHLARLSDRLLTSNQLYADVLSDLSRGKHPDILVIPVFSNIGEPQHILPLSKRQPWLVVFGGSNNRKRAYLESSSKISSVCKILGIKKIIDIGIPTGLPLSDLDGVRIKEKGKLAVSQIQEIFLNCRGGFLDYNPDFLAKSTIFAAYCSHGLLSICAKGSDLEIDGIESERHYLAAEKLIQNRVKIEEFQAIADTSYAWYQNHCLSFQAQIFANELNHKQNL